MDQKNIPTCPAPAPQPSYTALENPIEVIGKQFCAAYPIDLIIMEKSLSITGGNLSVSDINGTPIFKVKGTLLSLRDRRVLLDAAENPLVTLQQKILTAHRRWQVYRGDSTDPKDLLFSVKKSSLLQFSTHLNVFLASNTQEEVCDFKIDGCWADRSCVIHIGDSSNIIAQMHMKMTYSGIKNWVMGEDSFSVTVYPNVDYAFIVALVVVLNEINEDRAGDD